jgi:asparagine synthase (glutamine-hydrolysing)
VTSPTSSSPRHDTLCLGEPRFGDAALRAEASRAGDAAVWRRAAEQGRFADVAAQASGAFAVALHLRDETFIAVDRFALRSMCYRVDGASTDFAERADTLAAPGTPISAQAIYEYLYQHVIAAPRTIFHGVQRVPAAHWLHVRAGKARLAPYATPQFVEPARADFDALRDEFRALLRVAVAERLDGGTPACFLSGGTDSSTIAGMISLAAGRPAATYSIGFPADGYDEMSYARLVARHFGTDHHEYYVTPDDVLQAMAPIAASYDQPFGNSSVLPAYFCALQAKADGVSRLLAGDGGDELFGGNARYAKQRLFGHYALAPHWLQRGVLEPLFVRSPLGALPGARKVRSYIEQARVPLPQRMQMYNLLRRIGVEQVLAPHVLARIDPEATEREHRQVWDAVASDAGDLNRMLAYDWRYTLAECDLPKVVGSCSLAHIDVAFPMLDRRLVEFSQRLPAAYKLRRGRLRWFFKEALRGFLPDETLAKRKQGFGLPFGVWTHQHAGLRALATDALHGLAERGLLRPDFAARLMHEHLPRHPGYYGELVWILSMLEFWLRKHAGSRAIAA